MNLSPRSRRSSSHDAPQTPSDGPQGPLGYVSGTQYHSLRGRPTGAESRFGRTDRRYNLARWQRIRKAVLQRDNHACRIVEGCTIRATVADHVIPTYPGMPDSLFFGMGNLRAGCQGHNKARGFAPEVKPVSGSSAVVTKDYTGG